MTQHFTRNTSATKAWCPTCKRHTMHRVTDRRMGSCMEHAPTGDTKKAERDRKKREEALLNAVFQF